MKAAHYPDKPAPAPAQRQVLPLPGNSPVPPRQWTMTPSTAVICAIVMLSMLLLAGCGTQRHLTRDGHAAPGRTWPLVKPANPEGAKSILMRAFSLIGTPYRWGGNTPEQGFDCSGLVNFVYQDMLALKLPRTSRGLAEWQGPKVREEKLAAADLVFFSQGGQVFHVGIYVGEGRFIHAPRTGKTVQLDRLDGAYWKDRYSGARRVLR